MGCSVWGKQTGIYDDGHFKGTITEDSELNVYLNNTYYNSLSTSAKQAIAVHNFKTGIFKKEENVTLEETIKDESTRSWQGKIGLINPTDFVRASTNNACTSPYLAGLSPFPCKANNYLFVPDYDWYTINPRIFGNGYYTYGVYAIGHDGAVGSSKASLTTLGIRPVLFLKANLQLEGTGTSSDPYKIK